MYSLRRMAILAIVSLSAVSGAEAHRGHDQTDPDDIIYDLTVPWPFRHGETAIVDSDGDGVPDKRDTCPGTPRGALVDANGCPSDTDGDGVADGLDRCENTPAGSRVDARGCPMDSDGDGVSDGLDRCDNTPRGATVDASGCPTDTDGDGVADGLDKCPGTAVELAVDESGCPILIGEIGQRFLAGEAVAFNIGFASGKSDIDAASFETLDRVGETLSEWNDAEVEIGGHTDGQGAADFNRRLSESRAEAVKKYLTDKFPAIVPGNLSTKGYGESKPVASNDTAEGRAQNRRVEFTLMNAADLQKETETRRYRRRGE